MTTLTDVAQLTRWLAGWFAVGDLLVTALVSMWSADPMATWLMGSAASVVTFLVIWALGATVGLIGQTVPLPVVRR